MDNYKADRDHAEEQSEFNFSHGEKLAELGKLSEALNAFEIARHYANDLVRVTKRKRDGTDYDTSFYWDYDARLTDAEAFEDRCLTRIRETGRALGMVAAA